MGQMGRLRRTVWSRVWIGLLLVILPGSLAYGQQTMPHDQAEALQWIQETMYANKAAKFTNIRMENGIIKAQCGGNCATKDFSIDPYEAVVVTVKDADETHERATVKWCGFPYLSDCGTLVWNVEWTYSKPNMYAHKFQSALIYLAKVAQQEDVAAGYAILQNFKPKALAWQQMAVKPAVPEEAQRHQVLAEYAYKNKDIPKAIYEYFTALNIYPYWPEGQSNVAYLCAELGTARGYLLAAFHMKEYLMLAPNAPDAQAAQNSIFIWEDKAKAAEQ